MSSILTGIGTVDKLLAEADQHREAARRHYDKALIAVKAEKPATRLFLQTIIEQNAACEAQQAALTILTAAVLVILSESTGTEVTEISLRDAAGGQVS